MTLNLFTQKAELSKYWIRKYWDVWIVCYNEKYNLLLSLSDMWREIEILMDLKFLMIPGMQK